MANSPAPANRKASGPDRSSVKSNSVLTGFSLGDTRIKSTSSVTVSSCVVCCYRNEKWRMEKGRDVSIDYGTTWAVELWSKRSAALLCHSDRIILHFSNSSSRIDGQSFTSCPKAGLPYCSPKIWVVGSEQHLNLNLLCCRSCTPACFIPAAHDRKRLDVCDGRYPT